jgi:hypothetical protein
MLAFHAEKHSIKRDEIAARQRHTLAQRYTARLRVTDVTEMFR